MNYYAMDIGHPPRERERERVDTILWSVTSPAAFILGPVTSSTRTFQGTFSAQEESPPTTFREILFGQEPTSLFPQMSCKAISTGRADAMRVARVTEIRDVMMTELCSHLAGAGGMFPSVVTASH